MQLQRSVPVFFQRSLFLVFCIALNSCQWHRASSAPSIEFTHIPPAAQGGRERVDTISGRVRNAKPNQKIVIYAHAGQWWVQPSPDNPIIPIKADSTWSTETHLGFEYAALLVYPDYHPLPEVDALPTQFGSVALVTIVKGVGPFQFAPVPSRFCPSRYCGRRLAPLSPARRRTAPKKSCNPNTPLFVAGNHGNWGRSTTQVSEAIAPHVRSMQRHLHGSLEQVIPLGICRLQCSHQWRYSNWLRRFAEPSDEEGAS